MVVWSVLQEIVVVLAVVLLPTKLLMTGLGVGVGEGVGVGVGVGVGDGELLVRQLGIWPWL